MRMRSYKDQIAWQKAVNLVEMFSQVTRIFPRTASKQTFTDKEILQIEINAEINAKINIGTKGQAERLAAIRMSVDIKPERP